jgi:hypothetical protein
VPRISELFCFKRTHQADFGIDQILTGKLQEPVTIIGISEFLEYLFIILLKL